MKTRVQEADQRSQAAVAESERLQDLATRQAEAVSSLTSARDQLEVRAKSTAQELADARETVAQLTRQLEAASAREAHLQEVVASGKAAAAAAQARVVEAQAATARAEQRAEEAEDALGIAAGEADALRRDVNRQKDLRAAAVMGGAKEQERIQECVRARACARTRHVDACCHRRRVGRTRALTRNARLTFACVCHCPPGSSRRSASRRHTWTRRAGCFSRPRRRWRNCVRASRPRVTT